MPTAADRLRYNRSFVDVITFRCSIHLPFVRDGSVSSWISSIVQRHYVPIFDSSRYSSYVAITQCVIRMVYVSDDKDGLIHNNGDLLDCAVLQQQQQQP